MNSSLTSAAGSPLRSHRGRTVALAAAAVGLLFVGLVLAFPASFSSPLRAVRLSAGGGAVVVDGTAAASGVAAVPAAAAVGGVTAARPGWCDALLASPLPAGGGGCHPTTAANCGPGVPPRFFGQFGQDAWLYSQHFRHLRRPGVFLDVAANEAFDISNTYAFEVRLGR